MESVYTFSSLHAFRNKMSSFYSVTDLQTDLDRELLAHADHMSHEEGRTTSHGENAEEDTRLGSASGVTIINVPVVPRRNRMRIFNTYEGRPIRMSKRDHFTAPIQSVRYCALCSTMRNNPGLAWKKQLTLFQNAPRRYVCFCDQGSEKLLDCLPHGKDSTTSNAVGAATKTPLKCTYNRGWRNEWRALGKQPNVCGHSKWAQQCILGTQGVECCRDLSVDQTDDPLCEDNMSDEILVRVPRRYNRTHAINEKVGGTPITER